MPGATSEVTVIDRRFSQTQDRYAAEDLEIMQEARRYAGHVFDLFRNHIGTRVLEVGCGIGTMSRRLVEIAGSVVAIEPNAACADVAHQALGNHSRFELRRCHLEECDRAELAAHRFDTVFCVNVLEHIEDDVAALQAFRDVIEPGGRVLVFVPALQAAYGPLDAALGHHRRYSKRSLAKAFAGAGLDLLTLRYTNPIGLLGWMFAAHVIRSTRHSLAQIRLFESLVAPWALPLERVVPPPIGLSLVAVGAKRR
ncbi:MAG: class I SAM-dependent methyltransferase [Vicinamibacterales bacterium]